MDEATTIAVICHEANRAYCKMIGDDSQVPWSEAPDWQRDSAISGVKAALANQNATPESQHETWLSHKLAAGWKYGPVKDPAKLEHPCMVPYGELPADQRVKDELFLAIVRAMS